MFNRKEKITLSQLIGGLTRAVLKGQDSSTLSMLDTIHKLTETQKDGTLHPKYFTLKDQKKSYNLPLLSIIPVAHVSIDEADFEFDTKILEVVEDSTHTHEDHLKEYNVEYDPVKINISHTSDKPNIHVKIKLKNTPLPEKLRNYLTSLDHLEDAPSSNESKLST